MRNECSTYHTVLLDYRVSARRRIFHRLLPIANEYTLAIYINRTVLDFDHEYVSIFYLVQRKEVSTEKVSVFVNYQVSI